MINPNDTNSGNKKERFFQRKFINISLTLFLRFTCHFISGVIIFDIWCEWKNVPLYSLCYNGGFMLPELIFTLIGAYFLFKSKAMTKLIEKYK